MTLDGQPLPNSPVSLRSNRRRIASATTDAQGHCTMRVPPGTYEGVEACGAPAPAPEIVTVAENQTTKHDITCSLP